LDEGHNIDVTVVATNVIGSSAPATSNILRHFVATDLGSALIGNYDALDAATVTLSGSNVSQWDDKSANVRHVVQATAINQPTYVSGQYVEFEGTVGAAVNPNADFMLWTGTTARPPRWATFFAIKTVAFGAGATDSNAAMFACNGGANPDHWHSAREFGGSYRNRGMQTLTTAAIATLETFAVIADAPNILGAVGGSTSVGQEVRTNGVSTMSAALAANGSQVNTGYYLGVQKVFSLSRVFTGRMFEGVIADASTLSSSDYEKIEGMLAWRHSVNNPSILDNLDVSHPYKTTPPNWLAPVNVAAPVVTGSTSTGSLLTTTNGTWTGNPAPTFTYQWQRNGSNIGGETSATYTTVGADAEASVRCVVTGTNTSGSSNANSNALAVVDPDAAVYIAAVEAADGQALEAGVRSAISSFVVGCKADGIWTAIKAACILQGARTLTGALVPLVGTAPTNFNFVSGDYARKTGLKGDGIGKYLDSNRMNNVDPQNNKHLSAFVSVVPTPVGGAFLGAGGAAAGDCVLGRSSVDYFTRIHNATSGNLIIANTIGFKAASRTVGANYDFRNAGTNTNFVFPSGAPTSSMIRVFARGSPTPTSYSDARLEFYSIGEALNMALLDARVSTLTAAIDAAIP
jgi:hypothetical protein